MLLYRITHSRYASDLQGTGCLYAGGRWHYQGTRILYTSQHISLAKLEILANSSVIPKNQALVTLEIPETASIIRVLENDLPLGWWQFPYPNSLAQKTELWVEAQKHWIMSVPSAQSPSENNYLLNPLHSEHALAKIVGIEDIHFDKRLK